MKSDCPWLRFSWQKLASMVSYAPLDFDVASEMAAADAASNARAVSVGGDAMMKETQQTAPSGPVGGVLGGDDDVDESLLRRVLYVSGEEKEEHVRVLSQAARGGRTSISPVCISDPRTDRTTNLQDWKILPSDL